MGTTRRSGSRPMWSSLMMTAGRTLAISAPTGGSKSTSHTSPRLGIRAVDIQVILPEGFKGRQVSIVPIFGLGKSGGCGEQKAALFARQPSHLPRRPPGRVGADVRPETMAFEQ